MACLYFLHSESLSRFYTWSCDIFDLRIELHRDKTFPKSFTARANDWTLFFIAENLDYRQAREMENHVKKKNSSKFIRNLAKYPELVEKLKEKYR